MKLSLPLTLLMLILPTACQTMRVEHGIPNFAEVAPGIYRGGQPDKDGWAWLREHGVTRVVKLNLEKEFPENAPESMEVLRFPIDIIRQTIGRPASNTLARAVAAIAPGTYVHCSHGQDRTGLVIALWRVKVCGWTRKAAEAEMLAHGFHPELRGLYWAWEEDAK